jgi:hypothetical protein
MRRCQRLPVVIRTPLTPVGFTLMTIKMRAVPKSAKTRVFLRDFKELS